LRVLTAEDIEDYEEEENNIIWCYACEKRGYKNPLGPRILMPGEVRPEDYEDWYECAICGLIHHYVEIPAQEQIKDSIETQDSPYEDKLKLTSAHKRRVPKRKVSRHIKKNIRRTNDADILREIKQHGSDNVKVLYDSNP
jgi:hypothetical protein